jgi:orotate phosphoribosyltransferase
MTREEVLDIFYKTEALLEGHFRLTSGLHSPQYFQCAKALQYPQYAEALCSDIAERFRNSRIGCVISPAIGGIVVGQEVARLLGCRAIFAERENGQMKLRRGFSIKQDERILAVEDVVTTGGSLKEVIKLVDGSDGQLVNVGFIVDRSNGSAKFDVPHHAVFQINVVTYQPEDCPLCSSGVPAIKPGSRTVE